MWQYHKDDPNDDMTDPESFKVKSRFTNKTNNGGTTNVEIAVPLKYLSNFWRTLEMPPICKADRATTFVITDTKLYVLVLTLPTLDNTNLRNI